MEYGYNYPDQYLAGISICLFQYPVGLFRVNLTFWDELAHIAFQHVQKGNQIYVSGRLVADLVEADDGKQQTYYKVLLPLFTLFHGFLLLSRCRH